MASDDGDYTASDHQSEAESPFSEPLSFQFGHAHWHPFRFFERTVVSGGINHQQYSPDDIDGNPEINDKIHGVLL